MTSHATVYDVFNAKNLPAEEVAKTFIAPDEFDELCQASHSLLMGPRGCGKTTLFKMLTLSGIHHWKADKARILQRELGFTAVYIPSDTHWKRQLRELERATGERAQATNTLIRQATTTNILVALCETMEELVRYGYVKGDSQKFEAKVAKEIVRLWQLPPTLPLFAAVKLGLKARLGDAFIRVNKAILTATTPSEPFPDSYYIDYLPAAELACDVASAVAPELRLRRWALCFDELELSPGWLQERLFSELRNVNARLLYKLSTSPIPNLDEPPESVDRHDYSVIRLWPHGKREMTKFADALIVSFIGRRFGHLGSPEGLLGRSPLDGEEYGRKSDTYDVFRELARMDDSFASYLSHNGIDPEDPTSDKAAVRDSVLRKIKPLAWWRHTYLRRKKPGAAGLVRRSRKLATLYYGLTTIKSISDGNPRWLIGIMNDLVARAQTDPDYVPRLIGPRRQAGILQLAGRRFRTLIKALPVGADDGTVPTTDVFTLLKTIGEYFASTILQADFRADPVASFVVDDKITQEVLQMLRVAVYHGGIIALDPTDFPIGTSMIGMRFRLAHRLAPLFKLPLRQYDDVNLSSILSSNPGWQNRPSQRELFPKGSH